MLMTEHNLWFYQRMMQGMREAIGEGRFAEWATEFLNGIATFNVSPGSTPGPRFL